MTDAPERELARALEHGLRDAFPERARTALHLAELLLDAVDEALPLARGRGSAAAVERLAASTLVALPDDLHSGQRPPPALDALLAEIDAREASGSDFAAAQEEWHARLSRDNPSAADPVFRTFFAGVSQTLRLALSLRSWREQARDGRLPTELETAVGAIGAWQPERWRTLRHGVPAAWIRELCPVLTEAPPLARLGRECELALDLAGRLWTARDVSLTGFAALATLLFARTCSALALRQELG